MKGKYHHRRSLKRKIQNSIFRSTFISHLLLACILIPALLILLIPVGQIMTRGVAIEIIQRYTMSDMNKAPKSHIDSNTMNTMTEEQLIQKAIEMNKVSDMFNASTDQLQLLGADFFKTPDLLVDPSSSDVKRLILVSTEQYQISNQFFDKQLPFLKLYTMDFSLNNYQFFLPDSGMKTIKSHATVIEKYLTNTNSKIQITDLNNSPLGYLTVGINPNIVSLIVIPYITLMLCVSFGSLLVVSLLGKFMTAGILKPVDSLNIQLKAMADGDLDKIQCTSIVVKKAPWEITQLVDRSNEILLKMADNKNLLEAQNVELHTQNEELINTKGIIQKQQNMLVQTEKMASIGQLSAAIVHEINTPVGAIKSNAQMVQMLSEQLSKMEITEEQKKPLERIKMLNDIVLQASERVAAIIKSLKSYSRLDQSDFKESNINEDLQNVLLLTSNLWKHRLQIIENYGDIPLVKCYSGLLNQVFMNLVVNAIDATADGGTLTLTTELRDEEVVISIQDTGTGIKTEDLTRIFEEGFTTKSKNKGSGLGLALSKDIIDKHKGRIQVDTELEQGSTFSVHLPMISERT